MTTIFRLTSLAVAALFWMVAGVVVMFAIMMVMTVLGVTIGPIFLIGGPAGGLLLLVMLGVIARRVRERRAMLVLSHLEQTIRLNLPLPAMLHAAAVSENGKARLRFSRLREAIETGSSLGDAVAAQVPELPSRAVSLIAVGERLGQLPATLGRLVRESRHDHRDQEPEQALVWAYALVLLLTLVFVFAGISIFIMPSYVEIFADFDASLPWLTQVTIAFAWTRVPVFLLVATIVLALAAAGHATWQMLHTADRRPKPWAALTDHLLWCVPGVRSMVRDRALADVFGCVADALRAGQPMESALQQASELPMNAVVRRRLRRWADAVQAGRNMGEAARAARLPAMACGLIGPAQRVGEMARTFTFLGRYYQLRFSRLVEIGRATVLPAVVLIAALFVGCLVLAMFLPLVQLLETLTEDALSGGRL
ncbi:type II secretion system F family protein [Phycisphaerales bacterium AB-hyl4]|uniref:Type II secretion system F family protein n=1 Tax=Natronomicrosphaera hydrolytica TaxID=3242702 RepID=A0ABV4U9W0_9BACT